MGEPRTFIMEFLLPAQVFLLEDWRDAVHDETLRAAHKQGFMPVGPSIISDPEKVEQRALVEGVPLMARNPLAPEVYRVTCTMMLGVTLT